MRYVAHIGLCILLGSCLRSYSPQKEVHSRISLRQVPAEKKFSDSVSRFKTVVDENTGRVLVAAEAPLLKEGGESPLGNFVCDAVDFLARREGIVPDLIILNRGGLRANVPAGPVQVRHMFELMPFENELVTLRVKGSELGGFIRQLKEKKHPFKGMRVKFTGDQVDVAINGSELDPGKEYTVVTSDYLANGGDNFVFLQQAERSDLSRKIRDALIAYCEWVSGKGESLKPYTDGRLQISE